MTTAAAIETELLEDGGADVRELPAELDVIGVLRRANESSDHGLAWGFYLDIADIRAPKLTVGLRGSRGFVGWSDGRLTVYVPGTNTELVDYWDGGHHTQIRPGTETSAEYVFAALGEFLATHDRPTCVRWTDDPAHAA